jgi:hypothetical protein
MGSDFLTVAFLAEEYCLRARSLVKDILSPTHFLPLPAPRAVSDNALDKRYDVQYQSFARRHGHGAVRI